jgi:hypothetical protein
MALLGEEICLLIRPKVSWDKMDTASFWLSPTVLGRILCWQEGKGKEHLLNRDESNSAPRALLAMFAASAASLGAVKRPLWSLSSLGPLGGDVSLLLC